jgi:hypothetical protein
MTSPSFSLPPSDEALETLVNEVIDAECQGEDARALELMRRGVAEHPGFGARLAATRAAIRSLRSPVFVPDQRAEVLAEADFVRPFLSPRIRKQISASRVALAAGVVLTASLLTTLQYLYPEVTPAGGQPAAVGTVVEASRADAAASVRSLASVVQQLREGMQAPVVSVLGSGGSCPATGPLSLGYGGAYDADLTLGSLRQTDANRWDAPKWPRRSREALPFDPTLASRAPASLGHVNRFPLIEDRPLRLLGEDSTISASVRPVDLWDQLEVDSDGVVTFEPPQGTKELPPTSPTKTPEKK